MAELFVDESGARTSVRTTIPEAVLDRTVWGMLAHNTIPGVAPVSLHSVDGEAELRFAIGGLVALPRARETAVRRHQVLTLVGGIADAILAAEKYMIGAESFVLTQDHMWIDPATWAPTLIVVPEAGRVAPDIGAVLRALIIGLWYDRSEDAGYVGAMLSSIAPGEPVDLRLLSRHIRDLAVPRGELRTLSVTPGGQGQAGHPAARGLSPDGAVSSAGHAAQAVASSGPLTTGGLTAAEPLRPPALRGADSASVARGTELQAAESGAGSSEGKRVSLMQLMLHYSPENREAYVAQRRAAAGERRGDVAADAVAQPPAAPVPPPADVASSIDQGFSVGVASGESPLGGQGAAGFGQGAVGAGLAATESERATGWAPSYLFREEDGSYVPLEKPLVSIGRRRSRVDIAVQGEMVSKRHATLIRDAGGWSITDTGSTNGVEVDGARIAQHVPVRLVHGTAIVIGDERFIFVASA